VIGTDCIGSCKFNCHTNPNTTTTPQIFDGKKEIKHHCQEKYKNKTKIKQTKTKKTIRKQKQQNNHRYQIKIKIS
jgi:hypothetical protein